LSVAAFGQGAEHTTWRPRKMNPGSHQPGIEEWPMSDSSAERHTEEALEQVDSALVGDCRETPEAKRADPSPQVPHVPGYEDLQLLGKGGMGVVYRARQTRANRVVALKMILAGAGKRGEALERFRRESQTISRFRHPGIVQVYEVGEHAGSPYFSMEYCEGGHLGDRLEAGPLPVEAAAPPLGPPATGRPEPPPPPPTPPPPT